MRLGLGIGVNRRVPGGEYQFINAQASTYFSALGVAGFTEAQSLSLYSLTFNAIKEAIDDFFEELVTGSMDTKMIAMYPLIGGTAATHAINASNPGTFDVTWVGSPTHSATGTDFNGTTQFGKTGIIPSTDTNNNDVHLSHCCRVNSQSVVDIGCQVTTSQKLLGLIRQSIDLAVFDSYHVNIANGRILVASIDSLGLTIYTRTASNSAKIYMEGAIIGTTVLSGGTRPNIEIYLSCFNNAGTAASLSDREWDMASVGDGLTDANATTYTDANDTLQSTLGR